MIYEGRFHEHPWVVNHLLERFPDGLGRGNLPSGHWFMAQSNNVLRLLAVRMKVPGWKTPWRIGDFAALVLQEDQWYLITSEHSVSIDPIEECPEDTAWDVSCVKTAAYLPVEGLEAFTVQTQSWELGEHLLRNLLAEGPR